ncbi:MAG: DUF456 family protein [Thermoanaerobaculia bacterium]
MSLLWLVCAICVVIGFAGAVLPAIPGAPLVFLGLVAGAAADDFERVGWLTLAVLLVLTCIAFVVDFIATALGAKRAGASTLAIVGAFIGSLVGLAFGLPGLLLGPFAGAIAGEWIARRDLRQAGKVGFATWLGMLLAAVAKLAILCMMVGIFALAWWL